MTQETEADQNNEQGESQQENDLFIPSGNGNQGSRNSAAGHVLTGTREIAADEGEMTESFCVKLKMDIGFRGRVMHTVWLCLAFIGLGVVVGQVGPSFPDLRLIVNQELDVGTLIFTIFSLGYMLGSLIAGFLYDRMNKLFLIILCIWTMAVTSVVLPWCGSFPVMLIVRFVTGLGCGGLDTVGNADLVSIWDEAGRPYMQALHFCFGLGGIISPLFTEPFLAKKECVSYQLAGTEVLTNISTLKPSLHMTLNTTKEICTYGKTHIHYAFIITCTFLILTSIPFMVMFIEKIRKGRRHSIHANKDNLERPDKLPFSLKVCLLILISCMFLVYCSVEDSFGGLMMTFCLNYLNYDKSKGSLATSLYWATFSLGRFSGIFLIQMCSPITWLFTFSTSMVISILCFALSSVFLVYPLIWISTGLVGFACSLMFPCLFTWTEESVLKVTGMISSLFLLASSSGLMLNPVLLGLLMENLSPLWFAYLLFLESVLCLVLLSVIFLVVKHYVRPLNETECESTAIPLKENSKNLE